MESPTWTYIWIPPRLLAPFSLVLSNSITYLLQYRGFLFSEVEILVHGVKPVGAIILVFNVEVFFNCVLNLESLLREVNKGRAFGYHATAARLCNPVNQHRTPVLYSGVRCCESAQEHVSQVKVWAFEVQPGPSPRTIGICCLCLTHIHPVLVIQKTQV